jgi:hypothetical protein
VRGPTSLAQYPSDEVNPEIRLFDFGDLNDGAGRPSSPSRGLKVAFHSRFNSVAPGRASAKPAILVMRRLRNRKCEGLADAGAANPFALPRNSLVGVVEVPGVGQQARRQMSLSGTMKITGLSSPRRLRSSHL